MTTRVSAGVRLPLLALALVASAFAGVAAQTPARSGRAIIGTLSADLATGVALNAEGQIFVTGTIGYDPDELFALTSGAYNAPGDNYGTAYVMKLNPDGSQVFAARIGASHVSPQALALDAAGNVFIAGLADSSFPTSAGAVRAGTSTGRRAFVMKLSADGSTVLYSALLGPAAVTSLDNPFGLMYHSSGPSVNLAVDSAGSAFVSGTALPGFPTTPGAYRTSLAGASDGFVVKLNADGTSLLYSTFIGGAARDESHGIALAASGAAVVGGTTESVDFPTTALLHAGPASATSAFVARISADGSALDYSSRLSGENGAQARDIALGPTGDIYLTGVTRSKDFPVWPETSRPFDVDWRVPRLETFVTRLTADGATILYSTSLARAYSGSAYEYDEDFERGSHMAIAIAVDALGRAQVAGVSGARHNIYAQVGTPFSSRLDVDGTWLGDGYVEGGFGPWGSAAYDIAINQHGDTVVSSNTNNWYDVAGNRPTYGKDPDYPYWENSDPDLGPNSMETDGLVAWHLPARTAPPSGNTPVGGSVTVAPAGTGASVSFGAVTATGNTTVVPVDAAALNLTLPGGFALSTSTQAFEIRTSATVSGIQVCLSGIGLTDPQFAEAVILHGVDGAWRPEPTTRDLATRQLCATVSSLSPFALGLRLDLAAPAVQCAAAPATWSADNVVLACTASDTGVGLASPLDAAFTLSTDVADGIETANASTDSRSVCDAEGNCAVIGPIVGIRVDRRDPAVAITAPVNRRYLLNEVAAAAFTCADGGQIATCAGTAANGAPIDTSTAGARTFTVAAADAAGNSDSATVSYTVGYRIRVAFEQTLAVKRGKILPVAVQLQNALGVNVSSQNVVLTVQGLRVLSSGAAVPVQDSEWLNPDHRFRFASGTYVYALGTRGLAPGTYVLSFTAGDDPQLHSVQFRIVK